MTAAVSPFHSEGPCACSWMKRWQSCDYQSDVILLMTKFIKWRGHWCISDVFSEVSSRHWPAPRMLQSSRWRLIRNNSFNTSRTLNLHHHRRTSPTGATTTDLPWSNEDQHFACICERFASVDRLLAAWGQHWRLRLGYLSDEDQRPVHQVFPGLPGPWPPEPLSERRGGYDLHLQVCNIYRCVTSTGV